MNNDVEAIRKRMKKRKGVHYAPNQSQQRLTDRHFKKLYNWVIRSMVALLVGLSVLTFIKMNPGTSLKEYILNDTAYKTFTTWVSDTFLSFLPDQDIEVSAKVSYTHVEENYYTNNTNEVVNFQKGRVIAVDREEMVGAYVTVLFENDVEVTYAGMVEAFVTLYDEVEQGMVLGTYNEKLELRFEHLGKEINYETFIGME